MSASDFWKDAELAREVSGRQAEMAREVEAWDGLAKEVSDLLEIAREADKVGEDGGLRLEIETGIVGVERRFAELEFAVLFSEKHDGANALLAVHAGTGGVEAMDWAGMLLRMFLRYAERKGLKARILDEHRGAEAGVKSVTVSIEGRWAYGIFKSEAGVHRLVRISPFDAEAMRHTSFALVEILPELGEVEEVSIDSKDLRIDTFLSSGHGGQSVQTTYSAVRVTHIPTGIVVSCQNERSQTQNKETAMKILRAKLHALAQAERQEEKQKIRGAYTSAEWGNQIRSYVLHPYKLVKDHRTKHETSNAQAVLDGDLDSFVEAYLKWMKSREK
ncbi:peptide chain release factor 2 [Candidatus Uhrbacteria bacterium RIFCSPHIGHO2_12_FULL_57_11]|uniref:Peptide chain release factor 2 n=2 Tax=Candidatus Uhriibacteriota TaxID=1752732 RepID=A0A1F7UJM6_9BACT|nr:MAG: peptide chain release factor 2 [Candidatus Uhrbacteria bacterium RIFCSPHIGHO2_02_FULL_57_19]OGL78480.1 MAG: peptide chain release factor 2 [Candidatus Uhrbacteria bacterium RIFCSPHIGHO2_12_FULL_57_11]